MIFLKYINHFVCEFIRKRMTVYFWTDLNIQRSNGTDHYARDKLFSHVVVLDRKKKQKTKYVLTNIT